MVVLGLVYGVYPGTFHVVVNSHHFELSSGDWQSVAAAAQESSALSKHALGLQCEIQDAGEEQRPEQT